MSVGDGVAVSKVSKNPKSRSILGVRSNRRLRLFSERGSVVVVVNVRFLSLFRARDSDEASRIIGRQLGGGGVSNKRDFGGISDEGEGSGS